MSCGLPIICAIVILVTQFARVASAEVPPSFVLKWGSAGSGDGQFLGPFGVVIDQSGNVYVSESGNCRVQKFTRKGSFLLKWGSCGSANGQFNEPGFMAIDPSGNLYVDDKINSRVQKFTTNGAFLSSISTPSRPSGVAVDPGTGNVYVGAENCHCITEYTNSGGFIRQWGGLGTGDGQFNSPQGMSIDASGNLYVVDANNARIQKFTSSGSFLMKFGSLGPADGQLNNPIGIVLDASGDIFVTDRGNYRVQKFASDGTFITKWGSHGAGDGQFNDPGGIARDALGSLYVADNPNDRIERFGFLTIYPITDVGNDQGRTVRIRFVRSDLDAVGSPTPITQYEAFRRIDPSAASSASTREGTGTGLGEARALPPVAVEQGNDSAENLLLAGWEFAGAVPAHGEEEYTMIAPTLVDSTTTGIHYSVFFIRAATAVPTTLVDSPADSGYSVDNLPPASPAPFTGAYSSGATHLHWGSNTEPDFWYYKVYRGNSAGFVPGPSNLIATRGDTGYVDPGSAGSYYKLSAVDLNGNESGYSLLTPSQTLDVGGGASHAFALEGVRPNPARGDELTVRFVLPIAAPARLELLDVSGRRVVAREVGSFGVGWHAVDLAGGRRITPGLYLVRLTQGSNLRAVRVMVLD